MRLNLDRQIVLDRDHEGFVEVITEARKWTKGWVAKIVDGKRSFVSHDEANLSNAGFGERYFRIAAEGNYEAESACASLRTHRVRFDILPGGLIHLRRSNDPSRCSHLRQFASVNEQTGKSPGPYVLLRSMVTTNEPREAAISLGGHLEQHLQRLCEDRGLSTHVSKQSKGIGQLSSMLKSRGTYSKEMHKQIVRIAELRKRAQHEGVSPGEVEVTESVIAFFEFRKRHPATE